MDGAAWRFGHDGHMGAIEVWLNGGPADGRVLLVETDAIDGLPATVVLPQTGVFVNADDEPSPRIDHVYVYTGEIDGRHAYRYGLRRENL